MALLADADGACQCGTPLLAGLDIDAVVCAGIGTGALLRLGDRGIMVYATDAPTVGASLALLQQGRLGELRESSCGASHCDAAHNRHGS